MSTEQKLSGFVQVPHLLYHLSHHHFHRSLPAEDSIRTLHGHVGLTFLPWLEKAERKNGSR